MDRNPERPCIGVAIVTYRPGPIVIECLESLVQSGYQPMKIVICDNASPDDTVETLEAWIARRGLDADIISVLAEPQEAPASLKPLTLVQSASNLGFAGGVNVCLETLLQDETVDAFWLLNPDCTVPVETPGRLADAMQQRPDTGLLGGRILYKHTPTIIQSDGGRVNLWTGVCKNINYGRDIAEVAVPDTAEIDFVVGASVLVSRRFIETIGVMNESYFLFYEEVDWALRRKTFPIHYCHDAVIYHEGGTATESASFKRRASPVTNYFQYRNRLQFVARFRPVALPVAYGVSILKMAKLMASGGTWPEISAAFRGLHQLPPPAGVLGKLGKYAPVGKRP